MPFNPKAEIHQWTWYQHSSGKKYLCTSAGWAKVEGTDEYQPQRIYLLEFLATEPQLIATEKMIKLLETGALVVIKSPIG